MTGNKNTKGGQTLPLHTQPNLCRVAERICRDGQHANRQRALLSILEVSVDKIEKRD